MPNPADATHPRTLNRRNALTALGALSALVLLSCTSDGTVVPAVIGLNGDPTLVALSISAGPLVQPFSPGMTVYTATVPESVTRTTIRAIASSREARITINGETVASGAASSAIDLAIGENSINIIVTAANGSTSVYRVVVTRQPVSTKIPDATLE
jgi:hypothetical protein